MSISSIRTRVTVNGLEFACKEFSVTRGAYGSTGSFRVTSKIQGTPISIEAVAKKVGPDQRTTVVVEVSTDGGKTFKNVITGDLDEYDWDYDSDKLEIIGRDYSGRLVETRVVLKDSQYTNKTPSQIATDFANDVGLVPDVHTVPDEQPIGYLGENNMSIRTATPITKWALLVLMARLSDRAVLVNPGVPPTLFFGPVDVTKPPKKYIYAGLGLPSDPAPVKNLRGNFKLFKNSTFQVVVMSYHPGTTKTVITTTEVAGETLQFETEKKISPGIYKQGAAGATRLQIGEILKNKPAYFFYMHGLTPQECRNRSEALARDIAKHEFILKGTIDGDVSLAPLDNITIVTPSADQMLLKSISSGTPPSIIPFNLDPFKDRQMYIASMTHTFSFSGGFETHFQAWSLRSSMDALNDTGFVGIPTSTVPIE